MALSSLTICFLVFCFLVGVGTAAYYALKHGLPSNPTMKRDSTIVLDKMMKACCNGNQWGTCLPFFNNQVQDLSDSGLEYHCPIGCMSASVRWWNVISRVAERYKIANPQTHAYPIRTMEHSIHYLIRKVLIGYSLPLTNNCIWLRSLTIHPFLVTLDKDILYRKSVAPIVNGPPR